MAFFSFRKSARPSDDAAAEAPDESPATLDGDGGPDPRGDEGDDDEALDIGVENAPTWRERAEAVVAGGASTGSKRAAALYGEGDDGPTHYQRARGCELVTVEGERLIDCTMALGAVALGYGDQGVTAAVIDAATSGPVSGLSHHLEVELAERLCDVIPCAEQVRFLKSGAEACAAAVRIARTATGRDLVIGSGYFGWLDWWSDAAGVPRGAHADFLAVPFDDVAALEGAVSAAGSGLAAIMLEPVVERAPSAAWLERARALCDASGAVLIFDEIKTGFRVATGGWQMRADVRPDLATFGKAMANGYPLAAVVGRTAVMEAASRTWISSTLAGEATALAAAGAVLDRHEELDVADVLWTRGAAMRDAVAHALSASGFRGARVEGIGPMWTTSFDRSAGERAYLRTAREAGVLFKRGAYNFASLAHDEAAVAAIERAASEAFVALREAAEQDDASDG